MINKFFISKLKPKSAMGATYCTSEQSQGPFPPVTQEEEVAAVIKLQTCYRAYIARKTRA